MEIETTGTLMDAILFGLAFFSVAGILAGIYIWFTKREKESAKYGPSSLISAPSNIQGKLIWNARNVPTLGTKMTYQHNLELVQQGEALTGTFHGYQGKHQTYQGEIYLSNQRGKIEGRYKVYNRGKDYSTTVVHGVLGQKEAYLYFGIPNKDKKFSNQLKLQFTDQGLSWQASAGVVRHVYLSSSGQLTLKEHEITGQVIDQREWGDIDIQVSHHNASAELARVAVLLCCSEILRAQQSLRSS